jgi:TM2 domain-containing membrane protein YozV
VRQRTDFFADGFGSWHAEISTQRRHDAKQISSKEKACAKIETGVFMGKSAKGTIIMFCRNCGNQLDDKAIACIKCGADPRRGVGYCLNCGKPTDPNAVVCVSCGMGLKIKATNEGSNKIAAGLLAIFLGCLGIHKFIMGYSKEGVIMLLVSVLSCGFAAGIMAIIGLIEGIIYLTKSDEEFIKTYVENKKGWF